MLITTALPNSLIKPIERYIPKSLRSIQAEALSSLDTVQISGGLNFSVILKDDGSVWTFGRNDFGTLAQNDFVDRSAPTRVNPAYFNNEKVIQIEVSSISVIARTDKNKVYYWGNGTPKPSLIYNNLPVLDIDTSGKGDVNTIVAYHILTNEHLIRSSGNNVTGTFGIGTNSWFSALGTCTNTTAVSPNNFTYSVLKSGILETCPNNSNFKRIQDGTSVPLDNVLDMSVNPSNRKMLAYTSDGKLYTWGEGLSTFAKELPNADQYSIKQIEMSVYPTFLTTDGRLYYYPSYSGPPVEIHLENSSDPIIDIKSGQNNLLVLNSENKLYGLGPNLYGNLGSIIPSSGISFSTKVAAYTGIDNVWRIGAGVTHSILQYKDGNFSTLGKNSYGELSTVDKNSKSTFVKIPSLSNVKDMVAVNYSSYAVTNDNKFYSWGGRYTKEALDRNGPLNEPALVKDFSAISNIVDINGFSDSYIHAGILLENGEFWNFGENWKKGLGTTAAYYTFTSPVTNKNTSSSQTEFRLKSASQGSFQGAGISFNNKVFTWGYDAYGNLGIGQLTTELNNGVVEPAGSYAFMEPIVPNEENFIKVYSGNNENILLTDTGKVYVWGANYNNRFGMSGNPSIPTLMNTLPPIKEVAFGSHHILFLDFSGNVWAAGNNQYGALGLGNTTTPSIPTKIPTLLNIKTIGAGRTSSYAVTQQGELYSFGDNRYGELGLGDLIQRNEPRLVSGISDVKSVTGGKNHTLVLTNSGDLYVAGSDAEGQLGLSQSQVNSDTTTVSFPPNVTISTQNNQILTVNDAINVSGGVYTETPGVPIELTYQIESQSGKKTASFKSYTTNGNTEPYSFSLPLSGYDAGSYTLVIKATTNTGVSGQAAINFSVQDKIKPTVQVDVTSAPKWSLTPVDIKVTADDLGGSGYRGYRYAVTNSTSTPPNWSSINPNKTGTITIDQSGAEYLHIEAYDNIGNVTYLQTGPYYVDITPPTFTFSEPSKWQQDQETLDVSVQDASNIVVKKWMRGLSTMDEVKNNGTNLTNNSLPVTLNGIYSFYTMDENNQESFKTYNVSNINYQPIIDNYPSKLLIPAISKASYDIPTTYTHYDNGDITKLELNLSGNIITASNPDSTSVTNQSKTWNVSATNLTENTLYNGQLYIKDSKGGTSSKTSVQAEVYNPNFKLKSNLKGINISWTHSNLSQQYRLLKDGEVIYTGTSNNYFDSVTADNEHSYTLEVLSNGNYIKVASNNKRAGYNLFDTPNSINFPQSTIGDSIPITPTAVDIEYVKYEDLSDEQTPYSLKVSMTDFTSNHSSFPSNSLVITNVKKLNRDNLIAKVFSDIHPSSTPVELVSSAETFNNSYTKLELLSDNYKLLLPVDVKLSSGSSENFTATLVWEITYAP